MSEYQDITYEIRPEGVARITINRPEKMNAFRGTTCDEIIKALNKAGYDREVGCIVLAGAGEKAFCTGGDQSAHDGNYDGRSAWINAKTLRNDAAPAAEGVQFPRIPRWRINASLRYDLTQSLQASLGMRYASRPNTDLFGLLRGDTYGYTSELFALDARANWTINDHFRLSAGVDNLTNNKAWVFHPYPQRTFVVEAGWKL